MTSILHDRRPFFLRTTFLLDALTATVKMLGILTIVFLTAKQHLSALSWGQHPFDSPGLTQTFGGLLDLPNEATVPGWSNANPNNSEATFQGVTLTIGETLEIWSQGFNTGSTAGSDALATGHHAEVQVFDTVPGADVLTQSFVIPDGSSPATFSFDHWDRVFGSNQDGVLAVRVEGSISGLLVDTILPQSPTIWTPQSFSNLAVVPGETVTLSFSGALMPGGSGTAFPHVDQVRFEVSIIPEPATWVGALLAMMVMPSRRNRQIVALCGLPQYN